MPFSKPSAEALAIKELEESKRTLLGHQTQAEYHAHMVAFYQANIERLEAQVTQANTVRAQQAGRQRAIAAV